MAFLAHLLSAAAPVPPSELVGQKLVVRMDGRAPDAAFLRRIRLGQIGGVILYDRRNYVSGRDLRTMTDALQAAAAGAGRPPLLIAIDQEGGGVKQVPWAPPGLSPPQMGAAGSAAQAVEQGTATGNALHRLGVNADFAPVADVPATPRSFMRRTGRTWSSSAAVTSELANAFASGLERGGTVAVMKHFPGLGFADLNTDSHVEAIAAARAQLAPGLAPYRRAIARRIPMIMLSNAVYTAYDGGNAAGWSAAVGVKLLRGELGFRGVTITDSLDGAAHARGTSVVPLALRAARAGTDMILVTGSEATSQSVYAALLAAARSGELARAQLEASYGRIRALKRTL